MPRSVKDAGHGHEEPFRDISMELPYDAMELLGRNLRRLRREKNITQQSVADGVKMDVKHYQKLELEAWRDVRLSTVEKLARFYGLNAWRLLEAPLFREVVPTPTQPQPKGSQETSA